MVQLASAVNWSQLRRESQLSDFPDQIAHDYI